jgi:hypothetical protein
MSHSPSKVLAATCAYGAVRWQPARSGSTSRRSAAAFRDPDGDRLRYRWWACSVAGAYLAKPAMKTADAAEVTMVLPPNAVSDLHVVPEVTDAGQPPLTSYRQVVVRIIGLSHFDPSRLVRLVSEFGRLEDGHAAPLPSPACRRRRQAGEEREHGFCGRVLARQTPSPSRQAQWH